MASIRGRALVGVVLVGMLAGCAVEQQDDGASASSEALTELKCDAAKATALVAVDRARAPQGFTVTLTPGHGLMVLEKLASITVKGPSGTWMAKASDPARPWVAIGNTSRRDKKYDLLIDPASTEPDIVILCEPIVTDSSLRSDVGTAFCVPGNECDQGRKTCSANFLQNMDAASPVGHCL